MKCTDGKSLTLKWKFMSRHHIIKYLERFWDNHQSWFSTTLRETWAKNYSLNPLLTRRLFRTELFYLHYQISPFIYIYSIYVRYIALFFSLWKHKLRTFLYQFLYCPYFWWHMLIIYPWKVCILWISNLLVYYITKFITLESFFKDIHKISASHPYEN